MPILDLLTSDIIRSITLNLGIADYTRAELRNFLNGRITTVTDENEFSNALKSLTQDLEAGGGLAEGEATGSILGAIEGGALVSLEGGVITAKGAEIVSSILEIYNSTREGEEARNNLRNQIEQDLTRGVYHGAEGTPSRFARGLIEQAARQQERARQKAGDFDESERKFGNNDPNIRQRGNRTRPVEDDFGETEGKSTADPPNPRTGGNTNPRPPILPLLPLLPFTLIPIVTGGRTEGIKKPVGSDNITRDDPDPLTRGTRGSEPGGRNDPDPLTRGTRGNEPGSRNNPDPLTRGVRGSEPGGKKGTTTEDIDKPVGSGKLRADFEMLGTSYFNNIFNTPLSLQNSEWSEYDFVDSIDKQNNIQMGNFYGDALRFNSPMFSPKFQPKLEPPSRTAISLKYIPMREEVQLFQPFMNKFDGADMGRNMDLTDPYNRSVFDSNFENLSLYNPI
jgi:hypothetical protein